MNDGLFKFGQDIIKIDDPDQAQLIECNSPGVIVLEDYCFLDVDHKVVSGCAGEIVTDNGAIYKLTIKGVKVRALKDEDVPGGNLVGFIAGVDVVNPYVGMSAKEVAATMGETKKDPEAWKKEGSSDAPTPVKLNLGGNGNG